MKLDTIDQRHKFIDDLIKKGFEFEEADNFVWEKSSRNGLGSDYSDWNG